VIFLFLKKSLTYTQNCIVVELKVVGMSCVGKEGSMSEEKEGRKQNIQPRACLVEKRGDHGPLLLPPRANFARLQILAVGVTNQAGHIASAPSTHLDKLEILKTASGVNPDQLNCLWRQQ
jgi:hypothetical protein